MKVVLGWALPNLEMLVGTGEVHYDNRGRHKHGPRSRIPTLTVQPPSAGGEEVSRLQAWLKQKSQHIPSSSDAPRKEK